MTLPEYTTADWRRDEWVKDLRRVLAVLWEAACDADPRLRHERWRGHESR